MEISKTHFHLKIERQPISFRSHYMRQPDKAMSYLPYLFGLSWKRACDVKCYSKINNFAEFKLREERQIQRIPPKTKKKKTILLGITTPTLELGENQACVIPPLKSDLDRQLAAREQKNK